MPMKRFLILALVIGLGSGRAAASEVVREESQATFKPAGWRALEVDNARGEIRVRPSADGQLHLTALKIIRAGESRARELSRDTRVETRTEGGRFVVEVRYPQRSDVRIGFFDFFNDVQFPRLEVRMTLEVPAGLSVVLRSSSGDLDSDRLAAVQTFETRSGDVHVSGARAGLDISTSSGDVKIEDSSGARVHTSSGGVTIAHGRGPLSIRTSSGDVEIKAASDSVRVETASGDIHVDDAPRGADITTSSGSVELGTVNGALRVRTRSGDVTGTLAPSLRGAELATASGTMHVRLADAMGCMLEMRTLSGTLDVGIPMALRHADRREILGQVRHGTAPVRLTSVSGSIEVTGSSGGS
jgi:hypothetical protein